MNFTKLDWRTSNNKIANFRDAARSNTALDLYSDLSNSDNLEELFKDYYECLNKYLSIDGIQYSFPLLNIYYDYGITQKTIYKDLIHINNEAWGEISISRAQSFDKTEIESFKTITNLLLHPLRSILLDESNSFATEQGDLIALSNPQLSEQLIEREAKLALREQASLSIIIFDIDRFKNVAIESGNVHGDKILYQVVQIMKSKLRETDLLLRHDNNSFLLTLKNVTTNDALNIGNRILTAINEHKFQRKNGSSLYLTMSAGVTELAKHDSLEKLISRGITALEVARENGRNQCYLKEGCSIY